MPQYKRQNCKKCFFCSLKLNLANLVLANQVHGNDVKRLSMFPIKILLLITAMG